MQEPKFFTTESNVYAELLVQLPEPMRESLADLKDAFESKEVVSYTQNGKLRYSSSNPDHLLSIYNLSLVPRYSVPRKDEDKVSKYLDTENQAHYEAIFSTQDAKEDLSNRIEPQRKLNILIFGPKDAGKSTLTNFLNHFAGTIDANRMEEILAEEGLVDGPGSRFIYLWGQESFNNSLRDTWVKHYYPKSFNRRPLRARLPTIVPYLNDEQTAFNPLVQEYKDARVPIYSNNNDFQKPVSEDRQFGTPRRGNLVDSFVTQAPFIEPLYRLTTLDVSGFRVKERFSKVKTGVRNNRILSAIDSFKNAGHETMDALCLVIDGAEIMDINIKDLKGQNWSHSNYLRMLKSEVDQVIKVQKQLDLPIHVVFTHAREIFPYQDTSIDKQDSLEKLRLLLENLLGQSNLSKKVHTYAMDFSKLWGDFVSIREWNKDFRRCLYESNRLLSKIFEDSSQGAFIPLTQFEESVKNFAQSRASNIRLSFRGDFFDAVNLRLESSSDSDFNEDIEPILVEGGKTLAAKVKDLVAEDLRKVHEPDNHRNRSLPYLVGVVLKGKHPNVSSEKVEIFPLHHVYKLTNPVGDYPWIDSWKQVSDLNTTKNEGRLQNLTRSFARHQAERIVGFIEDVDLTENDTKILFVQIGSIEDSFNIAYQYNGYSTYITQGYFFGTDVRLHQDNRPLMISIDKILRGRDLALSFTNPFYNTRSVHSVSKMGGGQVSVKNRSHPAVFQDIDFNTEN